MGLYAQSSESLDRPTHFNYVTPNLVQSIPQIHLSYLPAVQNPQENLNLQEVEDTLKLMRDENKDLHLKRNMSVSIQEMICKKSRSYLSSISTKSSLVIRIPTTPEKKNFVVVINSALMEIKTSPEGRVLLQCHQY